MIASPSPLSKRASSSASMSARKSSSRAKSRQSLSSRQSIATSTSQPAVVIELGSAFLRIGFSGESTPRCILPSSISLLTPTHLEDGQVSIEQKSEHEWEEILTPLLDKILTDHLLIRPRNHRVLLVEPMITPTSFRRAITKVLLKTMQVPSLLFISDPALCPLHAQGWRYGLVLDMGRYETRTVASFHGRSLPNTFEAVPVGYENVLLHFQKTFNDNESHKEQSLSIPTLEDAHSIMEQCLSQYSSIDQQQQEELMMKCNIPSTQKALSISFQDIINTWTYTCFDVSNPDSITYAFLSTLLATPIDLRKVLLKNICIVGGGPSMFLFSKMFFDSFRSDVLKTPENSKFKSLIPCLSTLDVHDLQGSCHFQKSLINWVGASILGATMELNDERWVYRNVFLGDEVDAGDDEQLEGVGANAEREAGHLFDWTNVEKK